MALGAPVVGEIFGELLDYAHANFAKRQRLQMATPGFARCYDSHPYEESPFPFTIPLHEFLIEQPGESGVAIWQTLTFGEIRRAHSRVFRRISRRPLVLQGHILLCLEGELETELADGRCHANRRD